jgi:hypothetical protein
VQRIRTLGVATVRVGSFGTEVPQDDAGVRLPEPTENLAEPCSAWTGRRPVPTQPLPIYIWPSFSKNKQIDSIP